MNVISIKLTDEQLAWLQEQKDNRDRSIGYIVRQLVDRAMGRQPPAPAARPQLAGIPGRSRGHPPGGRKPPPAGRDDLEELPDIA